MQANIGGGSATTLAPQNQSPPTAPAPSTLSPVTMPTLIPPTARPTVTAIPTVTFHPTRKPTNSISITEFTTAPQASIDDNDNENSNDNEDNNNNNGGVDGIRDNPLGKNNEALEEASSTADALFLASIITGTSVLICCCCALYLLLARRRQSDSGPSTNRSNNKSPAKVSPNRPINMAHHSATPPLTQVLQEISFHDKGSGGGGGGTGGPGNEDVSTLGDPAGIMEGYGADESTAPVRSPLLDREDGSVLSIYTSGTDIRVSKDDNSFEDTYFAGAGAVSAATTNDDNTTTYHVEAPPGPLGLLIHSASSNGKLCVNGVKPDSVFAARGVQSGDFLVAVDNVDVQHMTPKGLSNYLSASSSSSQPTSRLFTLERMVRHNNAKDAYRNQRNKDDDDEQQHDYENEGNSNEIHC